MIRTSKLESYILSRIEFTLPLILSLFVFFLLINQTIGFLSYFKFFEISLGSLLKLVFFSLPFHLESLFSFCGTLAVIIALSRLSKNFELIAIIVQGISANLIFKTVFRFGLALFAIGFLILAWIRPVFFDQSEKLKAKIIHQGNFKFLENQLNPIGDFVFYFKKKEEDKLYNLLLMNRNDPLQGSIISAAEGEFQSSISNNIISFFLKDGRIVTLPQKGEKDKQIVHFKELNYPISLGKSIQLENISNRVLKKKAEDKGYTQLTLWELIQRSGFFKKSASGDLEDRRYYFIRSLILISRSLHNLSLPLMGVFLGFFHPRFPSRFIYLKFMVIYTAYYLGVSQLETSALVGSISAWWILTLPLITIGLAFYLFRRKIVQ